MKNLKNIAIATAVLSLGLASCQDVLDEQPRSIFEPGFFKTESGIQGGLTGLYQNLRYVYGNMYFYNSLETGTDEYTWAQSADNNFKDADLSGVGSLNPSSCRSDAAWGNSFTSINSASTIIENGESAGMDQSLIAEAYFFRAFNYFVLVQTFGGVPLDLGSGELKSNQTPSRVSKRNTVPEVYKAIFADLEHAVQYLPDSPRQTGTVTKTVARFFLSKAYLTFGWWLENPNNIPTYPECSRTDINGHDAKWYFQQSYDVALTAINNPGPYGLMSSYYAVNLGQNDRNKECLLYADRTESDAFYNGGDLSYAGGSGTEQVTVWAPTWNYCNIRCYKAATGDDQVDPCKREACQWGGRPWTRMAPTQEALAMFNDKVKDSRWDGTFVTVYPGNWAKGGDPTETYYNANRMPIKNGEAVLTFLSEDIEGVEYPTAGKGKSNVCAGEVAGRADWVIEPSHVSRYAYPGLWKLGTYRTDNAGGLGQPNGALTRPFVIAKFSELYLIAAEAAVKGATGSMSARDLVNVLRARAGKWEFNNAKNQACSDDFSADLVAATPATIDIDYILDERARELFGEGIRWYDLARTQTWEARAGQYTILDEANGDGCYIHKNTITRNIQKFNYLRPIPTGQLNALEMSDAEITAYQNPGYN
ncbi:MAG: RagB/SusD family nutrient uptake outer membrane protein [Bacteroidales bacterium]|nr:RagB/SusD family nutrient uptake outer membrane protein [Bacteroidales bacterium]